ncbi:MAG: hypothetical protein AAGF23_10970 [Acidobacteriota bacterium]
MLETVALTKTYGDPLASDLRDLTVEAGEVFRLLGADGAGETTTIHFAPCVPGPSSGRALVYGFGGVGEPLEAHRRRRC